MKKVVKKRNKKKVVSNRHRLVFVLIFVVYLGSSILLKNYNVYLKKELQTIELNNKELTKSNQTLKIKIDELSSFERMNSIAKKNGLTNREGSIKNVQ